MPSNYAYAALLLPGGTVGEDRFGAQYSDVIIKTIRLDGRGERRGGAKAENKTSNLPKRQRREKVQEQNALNGHFQAPSRQS